MMMRIDVHDLSAQSVDLITHGWSDIRVTVSDRTLVPYAKEFIQLMADYQRTTGRVIRPEETVNHGLWTVKMVPKSLGLLEAWDYSLQDGWVPGLDHTLRFWKEQRELCKSLGVRFDPPHGSNFAFVSAGVLEGRRPVEGVRYPSLNPDDSGWIFTTDLYNGDVETLSTAHLYHVVEAIRDVSPYLATPPGHFFRVGGHPTGIWFDPEVAEYQG